MINLEKGQKIELTKENPNLKKLLVGLGWDVNQGSGAAFDLDASALLLDASGKIAKREKVVYYGHLQAPGVKHTGDNLTGEGDGDDEQLLVDLSAIDSNVDKIVFTVTIYQAGSRHQNFGMVKNAFIRIANNETNEEVCKYDLGEDYSTEKSVIVAELYRHNGEWKFGALGNGFAGELGEILSSYGLN
jgi:tellurium resistance protein TerD